MKRNPSGLIRRNEIGMLALLLFALLLRVYRLDTVPPGLYRDEAYNGIDALRILQTGARPIFFEANTGREPLFIYIQTLAVALLGVRAWTLRLVSVFVGILMIALLFRLSRELFDSDKQARWIALVAAAGLTVSYWHLHFSRMGFRALLFAALGLVAVFFFLRGWKQDHYRDWLLGGVAVAATFYSYTAARLFPLVFVLFIAVQLLGYLRRCSCLQSFVKELGISERQWHGLVVMSAVASVLMLPLIIYFLSDPISLLSHSRNLIVLDPANPLRDWWRVQENTIAVVRMFIDRGDPWITQNLPNRAALDAITALGFWIGLAIAMWRMRQLRYLIVLSWLAVTLLPTILSSDAPNYVRAMGALPPIFLLVAEGLTSLWKRLAARLNPAWLVIGVIVVSGGTTAYDYFFRWAVNPETYQEFDAGIVTISERVGTLVKDYDVVMPFEFYGQPTPRLIFLDEFMASTPLDHPWSSAKPTVFITTDKNIVNSAVVLFHFDQQGTAIVPALLDQKMVDALRQRLTSSDVIPITNSLGWRVGKFVEIEKGLVWQPLSPDNRVDAKFGDEIGFIGFDLQPTVAAPGDIVNITLYWESFANIGRTRTMSVTLQDAMEHEWVVSAKEPWGGNFATDLWRKGEVIPDTFQIRVPAEIPNGKFQFKIEVWNTDAPDIVLGAADTAGRPLGDQITIGVLTVDSAPGSKSAKYPLNMHFGEAPIISLEGFTFDPVSVQPGAELPIELIWRSNRTIKTNYTVFVHLLDAQGNLVAQHDSQPQRDFAPMTLWSPGETIVDLHPLLIPGQLEAGEYTLIVGLYDLKTGDRLPTFDSANTRQAGDQVVLTKIKLR